MGIHQISKRKTVNTMNTAKGLVIGIAGTLLVLWLFSRLGCAGERRLGPDDIIVTKTDTIYKEASGKGNTVPTLVKVTAPKFDSKKTDTTWSKGRDSIIYVYVPDSTTCCKDREELYALFTTQREYLDQIWLDSTHQSSVTIRDTLAANQIVGRGYEYNWTYPVITTTTSITKKEKQRLQLLIGGGIAGTRADPLKLAELEALIRGKKGGAIGLNIKYDLNTTEKIYGVKKLWLVSFRRK
jgi:hypothetical protein